ncbi:MAG: hypothetical protein P4L39_10415 [Humidesulfovibrio sp.]|nr:hypothetical protein [Humidesulfovibrio sp.]
MSTTTPSPYRIATQTPETASGFMVEAFKRFPPQVGVPEPMLLFSASPGLVEAQFAMFGYFGKHPHLSPELLAAIRYLASRALSAPACLLFNGKLLGATGLTAEELNALPESGGEFTPAERSLLAYVVRLVSDPTSVTDENIEVLRQHGWTDSDIMDASMQAANMQTPALLLKALKR